MISRGLLISLVVTGVSTACLWLYFKNRLGECEKKVDLMFDFIQDHEQRQMQTMTNDNIQVSFNKAHNLIKCVVKINVIFLLLDI